MPAAIRTPVANSPVRYFTIVKVFPNGKNMKVEDGKPHLQVALAKLIDGIYDPIVKRLPISAPYKGKGNNFTVKKDKILQFFEAFNIAFEGYGIGKRRQFVFPDACKDFLEPGLLSLKYSIQIVECAYSMAVPRPSVLNGGRGNTTYGETSLHQVASFVNELNIGSKDVFIDLGSGIGQIVLFMSAFSKAKQSIGIEMREKLSTIAKGNLKYYNQIMSHVGKRHGSIKLFQGSMLEDRFHQIITQKATVIFVNNFKFCEDLMVSLRILLSACKSGMRIISSKPLYYTSRTGQTARRAVQGGLGELENISTVEKLKSVKENVSWSHKKHDFWLTTIVRN